MAHFQFGDKLDLTNASYFTIKSIEDVVPIKYDPLDEQWVVCAQKDATHMLVVITTYNEIKGLVIEIGKCDNLYLLADAIVD